ncbi:SoxR reducing system RseC family protein [Thermodesulfobacteriota bacterium]
MIKEQGMIEKVIDQKAVVRVQKTSACAQCKTRGSCSITNRDILIEVSNDLQAGVGDHVEISVPEGTMLKLAAIVYILPIIALISGAFLGGFLAKPLQTDPTWASILGGGLVMGIAFYGLKRFEKVKRSGENGYYPRMTRIKVSATSLQHGNNI